MGRSVSSWGSTHQDPGLDISESQLGAVQERLFLAVDPVVFTDILFQPPCGQLLFLLSEPGRGTRKVGQDEKGSEGDHNSDGTLNDEQPTPGSESFDVVHVTGDTSSDQTGESAREQGTRVQCCRTEAEFLSGVPGRQEVQTTRLGWSG